MSKPITYRKARQSDARFIAKMIDISSDGIASIEWGIDARSGTSISAIDIGGLAYSQENGDYSYRNCLIAESYEPVGVILAFPITEDNYTRDAKAPPYSKDEIYAPYEYLEALNSWYICGVAVLPEFREQGIATRLIEMSMQIGRQQGYSNISLIAMIDKPGLIKFYQSRGFQITASAPIVDHPKIRVSGLAVQMETSPNNTGGCEIRLN